MQKLTGAVGYTKYYEGTKREKRELDLALVRKLREGLMQMT